MKSTVIALTLVRKLIELNQVLYLNIYLVRLQIILVAVVYSAPTNSKNQNSNPSGCASGSSDNKKPSQDGSGQQFQGQGGSPQGNSFEFRILT